MPAKPVKIGALNFPRKRDANEFFTNLLYRYNLGDKVTRDDAVHLTNLLAMHPEADVKIGVGIKSFSVRTADYGKRCFWVNRSDETTVKFSFKSCY